MLRPDLVRRALELISARGASYEYFFDQLDSPDWIKQLSEEGMFRRPPEPEEKGGYISFPEWPESRYLARMASKDPETVFDAMEKIPTTDNVRVHEDLADAACGMPAQLAARWAKEEARWLQSQDWVYLLLPEKLAELVSHLSRGDRVDEALRLARSLLAVRADPREEEKVALRWPPEPCARFEVWEYGRILKKHVPDLVRAAGERSLRMLCGLLQKAVKLSKLPGEQPPGDASFIWRPAVEEHEQNREYELRGVLVTAIRDASESLMKTKGKVVLNIVEKRPYRIFHRLGLHLRRKWPDIDPEGTAACVTDPEMLVDSHVQHELSLLLQERFGSFAPEVQKKYFLFVLHGPDLAGWPAARERGIQRFASSEEVVRYVRSWQLRRLLPVQTFLEGEWKERFEELTEFQPPEHPEFPVYTESFSGPPSPKRADDLRVMSVEELVSYLKSWQPPEDPFGSSREGLARELVALVTSEPERLGVEAGQFEGLDPEYVRGLLWGLTEAARKGRPFPWEPVLALCRWVLQQRDEPLPKLRYEERDPGWAWGRKAISDLLTAGFENPAGLDVGLRTAIWEVLRPLTDDDDPTPKHDERGAGYAMEAASLSINTTRGQAMHAVVHYALWVRQHMMEDIDGRRKAVFMFKEMPEVCEVLDHHLASENDPSPAIRAVYGQRFPELTMLDREWASRSVEKIFPTRDADDVLREAAWETYVMFRPAQAFVVKLLPEQYALAIERLGSRQDRPREQEPDPNQALAQHIVSMYWQGLAGLEDDISLVRRFYERAAVPLRGHAMDYVGRSLKNAVGQVRGDILERLQALCEWRVEEARKTSEGAELVGFGWWFASGKFDDSWALEQLAKTLELAGKTELDFMVAERLAELAGSMPMQAVRCLRLMVEGDKDNAAIYGWREHGRSILKKALESTDEEAQKAAEALVHLLGARGHLSFRDLLPGGPPDPARVGKDP